MSTDNTQQTWPDLAIGLYDKLTGRGAEITYDFDDFSVRVPGGTGTDAPGANWTMNGTLKISTRDRSSK